MILQRLIDMDARGLIDDLARRRFPLAEFKKLLKTINCRPAMNVFEDASEFYVA